VDQQLQEITRAIRAARCARAKSIDGIPCGDVESSLLRISLSDLPDGAQRTQLLSIPTTLTLSREQVDALIAAGQGQVMGSSALQQFLRDYPPRTPAKTVAARGG
jgi:hypothetical protein